MRARVRLIKGARIQFRGYRKTAEFRYLLFFAVLGLLPGSLGWHLFSSPAIENFGHTGALLLKTFSAALFWLSCVVFGMIAYDSGKLKKENWPTRVSLATAKAKRVVDKRHRAQAKAALRQAQASSSLELQASYETEFVLVAERLAEAYGVNTLRATVDAHEALENFKKVVKHG